MGYNVAALSKLIEQFERMPSVGRKSAQRMAFYVLNMSIDEAKTFANAIVDAHEKIHQCKVCCNILRMMFAQFVRMPQEIKKLYALLRTLGMLWQFRERMNLMVCTMCFMV